MELEHAVELGIQLFFQAHFRDAIASHLTAVIEGHFDFAGVSIHEPALSLALPARALLVARGIYSSQVLLVARIFHSGASGTA